MRVHFVRSNKIGSRLIRAITGESVSHVGLEFDSVGVVIHATPQGVDVDSIEHFRRDHEVVISLKYTGNINTKVWEQMALRVEGTGYDFLYLLLLGTKLLIQKTFGLIVPPLARYMARNKYICTEFVEYSLGVRGQEELTPGQLGTYLLRSGQWEQTQQPVYGERTYV